MRPASHQDISSAVRSDPARPRRNGSVYRETIVPHTPATSTAAGSSSSSDFPSSSQNELPLSSHPKTYACHSTIHLSPTHTQLTSCCNSEVHCSVWMAATDACMNVPPR